MCTGRFESEDGELETTLIDQKLVEEFSDAKLENGLDIDSASGATPNDDTMTFGTSNQTIDALAGDDSVTTGTGNDLIYGNDGNDTILAATGADTIYGGDHDDHLVTHGGTGFSTIYGDGGNDQIYSGSTFDFIYGGDGDDLIDSQVQSASQHDFIWAGAGNDSVIATNFDDGIRGDEGNDTIDANGGRDIVYGGDGDDILNGGSGDDRVYGGLNNDTLNGGSSFDLLYGGEGDDWIVGSVGGDLHFGGAGSDTLDLSAFANVPTIDLALGTIGSSTGRIYGIENYVGGPGSDTVFGSDLFDNSLSGMAGNDTLIGRGGNDTLVGGLGADSLDGGDGSGDVVSYASSTAGVVINLSTNSASGGEAEGDRISGFEHIIGSSAGDTLTGTSGNNSVEGGGGIDVIFLQHGGDDDVSTGDGNDGIFFGAEFSNKDIVDGGAGGLDQLALQGDYSAGLTFGANSTVGIEQVVLLPGNIEQYGAPGDEFYSYNFTLVDENINSGGELAFQANLLRAGENLTIDASAEKDGYIFTYAGEGTENLIGTEGDDAFFFGTGRFNANDRVDGYTGTFDSVGLQGDYSEGITFGADQLNNIDILAMLSSIDPRFGGNSPLGFSYDLKMNDGNVASGASMIISANTLRIDEVLTFDGSAELDGSYRIFSGNGADRIIGSQGADTISGRGAVDMLTGAGGDDVFLYTNITDSQGFGDQITDFTTGDRISVTQLDADVGVNGDQDFSFIGSDTFSNTAGELRAVNTGGNAWIVELDVRGDGFVDVKINVHTTDGAILDATDFIL